MSYWFLCFGLFLPRWTLLIAYLNGTIPHNEVPYAFDVIGAILFPRFLIADYCFENQVHPLWIFFFILLGFLELFSANTHSKSKGKK